MTRQKTWPPVLTIEEAATYLHVSPSTVKRLKRRGQLRVVCNIGRRTLFPLDALEEFVQKGAAA